MKKWVVIAAWLIAAAIAFPFQSKLQVLASDESDAFKDNGAESSQVDEIIEQRFEEGDETTAVVVYTRQDQQRMLEDGLKFCEKRRIPDVVRVITAFQGICGELPEDHLAAVEHDQAAERGRLDGALDRLDERRRHRVRGPRRRRHARGPAGLGLRDRRGGLRRRPGRRAGGHRRDAADRDADPRPRPAAAHLPQPRDRAGAAARGRDRVHRRRGRRVRGRAAPGSTRPPARRPRS